MAYERLQISLPVSSMAWLILTADACKVSPAEIIRRLVAAERAKPDVAAYLMPPTKRELETLKALRERKP